MSPSHRAKGREYSAQAIDYLAYLKRTRRVLGGAALTSLFFACLFTLRVLNAYGESVERGNRMLLIFAIGFPAALALIPLTAIILWIPAVVRIAVLRRRMPEARFFIAKLIPGFWQACRAFSSADDLGPRLQNSVISVERDHVRLWRGVAHPRMIATFPLSQLVAIDSEGKGATPFRRRLIVLSFQVGANQVELPLALRRVAGIGFWRVSAATQAWLLSRLTSNESS